MGWDGAAGGRGRDAGPSGTGASPDETGCFSSAAVSRHERPGQDGQQRGDDEVDRGGEGGGGSAPRGVGERRGRGGRGGTSCDDARAPFLSLHALRLDLHTCRATAMRRVCALSQGSRGAGEVVAGEKILDKGCQVPRSRGWEKERRSRDSSEGGTSGYVGADIAQHMGPGAAELQSGGRC